MTIGEIYEIGRQVGKEHIDKIAEDMVKAFIEKRIEEVKKNLKTVKNKKEVNHYRDVLDKLENAESLPYYKILVDKIKDILTKNVELAADNARINLTNAEYFDFTGKLHR